ncbi:MAG: 2-C-methyl-D-erythritol 2,4-cyclodiphosphate synthase [Candidatus Gracilibacteria bacterium]|jgi:2-C-methyl-D-erythritol 4-phosphate cytidylyltransferase/2-C-methyl-D-erythritol 2,4-cyclodiphosphate synthase
MKPQVKAILLAAGKSTRYGGNKLFLPVLGSPLIYHSLLAIHDCPEISEVFIVANASDFKRIQNLVKESHFPKVSRLLIGGKTRQESMVKGLGALSVNQNPLSKESTTDDIILIHNAANPLVTEAEILAVIKAAQKYGGAICGKKIVDTVKEVENDFIIKTHNRNDLRAAQTPQAFQYGVLKKAISKAKKTHKDFTDEAGMVEDFIAAKNSASAKNLDSPKNNFNHFKIKFVSASENNFKITTPADYERLKAIVGDAPKDFLVGIGQDSHEFENSNDRQSQSPPKHKQNLILGGFNIPNVPKLKADSDGDVVIHALCNAILQALGEKSLGYFATPLFKEKNVTDSRKYLANALAKVTQKGYILNNIGLMIEGRKPKMDELSSRIRTSLGKLVNLNPQRIGLTATTGKNLTAFGKGKGLQCLAIVSLKKT